MMKAKSGFTLVEILIVVVILGILAAIVIPQFTEASTEAKMSRLCTDLQTMRSQIELYKVQHNDHLPGVSVTGTHETDVTFQEALTGYTNISGIEQSGPGANVYGPYVQQIPENPFNELTTIRIDGADAGANTQGWRFDTTTGAFQADDSADHSAL
jgi:general secretion pathway protein G